MYPGASRGGAGSAGWEPERQRWAARWIWSSESPETPSNSYFLFRTEFSLDGCQAEGVRLFITAETRYRVLANSTQVGEGPPPSPPHYQYYDTYDLSPHLRTGANCLAVIVHFVGNEAGRELTRGGLLAEVADATGNAVTATGTARAGEPGEPGGARSGACSARRPGAGRPGCSG